MNSNLLLICLAAIACKVSGQMWPSGGTTTEGATTGAATTAGSGPTGAPGSGTTGSGPTGAPGTSPPGGCKCEPCKKIGSGKWRGMYMLWEDKGGRCGHECAYIRQEDNKVFCMCEPGPVDFVKPSRCPAFRTLQCSVFNKCIEGQGDCDRDNECQSGLVCGDGNCSSDKHHPTDDCCYKR